VPKESPIVLFSLHWISEDLRAVCAGRYNALLLSQALSRLMWARCALNSRGIPAGSVLGNKVPEPAPLYGSCLLQ
jgi:hypothetical protein